MAASQFGTKAGLNATEIYEITSLLKDKLNFTRDIRAGDDFEVVVSRQSVDDKLTVPMKSARSVFITVAQ
ncbi:hypothetical protein JCM19237_2114 [Photobacterium aphoticum]|uniref:Uncharacterized protein n=1 Tax=Photobacterium aphoticum TaxID=754436 RepID=A0A090QNZ6_9GAMM|nr:hypothetical protein JCM19237_2114 [Photobacterium aphoticum]